MASYDQLLQRKMFIECGLLELMESVPYPQISITSLTQHLGISRKSFYHYFPGKEACLDSLLSRCIQECALYISAGDIHPEPLFQTYIRNLEYWKSQAPLLKAIQKNSLEILFLRHCVEHVLNEERQLHHRLSGPELLHDQDVILFYVTGQLSLMLRWCYDDFNDSIEAMARKMLYLLTNPLIQK